MFNQQSGSLFDASECNRSVPVIGCKPTSEAPTGNVQSGRHMPSFIFGARHPKYSTRDPEGRLNADGLRFNESIFAQIQARCGKNFTLDACADSDGNNRLVENWCSPAQPFTKANCEGYHVWLAPPVLRLQSYISHYLKCKNRRPSSTSACILVPKWPRGKHAPLLKGMKLLQEYPAGTELYTATDGRKWTTPWAFQVWYDAPAVLHAGYVLTDTDELVLKGTAGSPVAFDAQIQGTAGHVKIDTGASHNFLRAGFVEAAQIAVTPCAHKIELADGTNIQTVGTCKARVKIGRSNSVLSFYVLRLATGYDALLGEGWLKETGAKLCFDTGTLTIKRGRKTSTVHSHGSARQQGGGETSFKPYVHAAQVVRDLRKGGQLFWGKVKFTPYPGPPDATTDAVAGSLAATTATASSETEGLMPQATLDRLLDKHKGVFAEIPPGLTEREHLGIPNMRIELQPGKTPPVGVQYRLSKPEREECERQIKAALEKGWISPSTSAFAAPILFVRKKDGVGLRMCCDYRALNRITIKQVAVIPRVTELLDALHGVKVLSAIDLQSGYNQLVVDPADRHKLSFRTPMGVYQWNVVPFGVCNAPAYFSAAMNTVMAGLLGKCVLVYLDDILVFSKSAEQHEKDLDMVLSRLAEFKLYAKQSKCHWNLPEVEFLGHFVGRNGVRVDPRKVQIVQDWPVPKNVTELRSFLGLTNYFRRFVHAYSAIARPLHALTGDKVVWNKSTWTAECQEAFDLLKRKLTTAPILALPDWDKDFEIICDASKHSVGAILVQDDRPLAFESRRLTPAEVNYDTTERELVAVMHALNIWRCYLDGKHTKIVSDHEPLKYLQTKSTLNPRQIRWSQFLERFSYTWEFRAGRLNAADPLSRAPHAPLGGTGVGSITGYAVADDAVQAHLAAMTRSKSGNQAKQVKQGNKRRKVTSAEQQTAEDDSSKTTADKTSKASTADTAEISWLDAVNLASAQHPDMLTAAKQYQLQEKNGLWYRPDGALYIPTEQLQQRCLQEMHDAPYSGHKGIKKTLDAVSRLYWWPAVTSDVKQYVRTCIHCQRNKAATSKPGGLLQPLPVPTDRWAEISMDYVTGLPCTARGNDAILVICDRLTKMVHFCPCSKTDDAADAAGLLRDVVFTRHGWPEGITCDRDPRWTSKVFQELMKACHVKLRLSTAFHPQTDGQTERTNRVLEEYLRHYVNPHQDDWDEWLSLAEYAYNNSVHEATGHTPFFLNYGRHPHMPGAPKDSSSNFPAVETFVKNVAKVVSEAKERLEAARQRAKRYADPKRKAVLYKVGDLVLLSTKNIQMKTPGVNKLLPKYLGPFPVTEVINAAAYRLQLPDCMRCHNVFHASLLQKYRANGSIQPPPLPLDFDDGEGGEWFEIETILDMRTVSRGRGRTVKQYLVKWKGFGDEHNMWCDEEGVTQVAVDAYHARNGVQRVAGPPPTAVATARPRRGTASYQRGRFASSVNRDSTRGRRPGRRGR